METRISSRAKEVMIGDERPTVLIGERINPTGKKKLTAALQAQDMEFVRKEALAQMEAGADILDVNVGVTGMDEVVLLPQVLHTVMETVDLPLSIDTNNPKALEAALKVYQGKPLVNSVNGEERSLKEVLPLVKQYGAAVVGLTMDEKGIPKDSVERLEIAQKIVKRAEMLGIPRNDIIIDCLAMTVGADTNAGLLTIEAVRRIKAELGVNLTLGVSNISFGLPDRDLINSAFLAIAIAAGVNSPIVDVIKVRPMVLATDLILGHDRYAMRHTKSYRQRQKH